MRLVGELWTCPSCQRRFANANQWHSCIEMALEQHLASKSAASVAVFRAVEAALRECGDFRIHPQKTRVAFVARMTFAGVRLAHRWADLSFVLPAAIDDHRVRSLDLYGPTSFGHGVRLIDPSEVDGDVRAWLCAAHARGEQRTLDPDADVAPVVGTALELLSAPLRARVVASGEGVALALPRYVAQAFAEHPEVVARIRGRYHRGVIHTISGRAHLDVGDALRRLGLGVGDRTDAFLKADL